jgi:hypothetical protein
MKNWLVFFALISAIACTHKKADLSGEEPVKINDFLEAFPIITLPYTVADTNVSKAVDTIVISHKVFTSFIPDSTLTKLISAEKKSVIKPFGKIDKQKETYLLATFTHNKTTKLAVFVFDKKNNFLAAKELLSSIDNDEYTHSLMINKEPTFLLSREKTGSDKQLQYTRTGWVYGSGSSFMVVINDGNESENKRNTIIDPIDTLPKKNKLSGNYVQDKKNFISIRDGKNVNSYLFFIHFEKKDGNCSGELKGTLHMRTPTTAVYSESGDPCIIDFSINGNTIEVKEQGSCGNRRGMECFFDDSFTKRREPKAKASKKK